MSMSQAVVVMSRVVNVVTATPEAAQQLQALGAFPAGARLFDVGDLVPMPGIGWHYASGGAWTEPDPPPPPDPNAPPPAPAPPPPPPAPPAEGTTVMATLVDDDPLTLRLDDGTTWTSPQVVRHAGYSPTAGDNVEASWRQGAWLVRDAVVGSAGS